MSRKLIKDAVGATRWHPNVAQRRAARLRGRMVRLTVFALSLLVAASLEWYLALTDARFSLWSVILLVALYLTVAGLMSWRAANRGYFSWNPAAKSRGSKTGYTTKCPKANCCVDG